MKWITRQSVRIDRVASAWLIQRFVDRDAEFLFAPGDDVIARAASEGATPFHVPGCDLGQRDERTGFDAIVAHYGLHDDPALDALADIVRAADGKARAPEGPGVAAMSHGFAALGLPDERVLELEVPAFEALYAFCTARAERTPKR